jgi:hypothetical protein
MRVRTREIALELAAFGAGTHGANRDLVARLASAIVRHAKGPSDAYGATIRLDGERFLVKVAGQAVIVPLVSP